MATKNPAAPRAASADSTQMSNKDIMNNQTLASLLETGKVVLIERKPSAKNEGAFDYQFAQQRANAISPELAAIATLRSDRFKPVIMRTWVSSIDAVSDQANIDSGLVTLDAEGNFEPSVVENMKIVVREHKGVGLQHVYINADDEVTFSSKRVKRNRDGEIICTEDGTPIMRETILAGADAKDVTVAGNTPMEEDDFDAWKEEWLQSQQAEEFATALAEA